MNLVKCSMTATAAAALNEMINLANEDFAEGKVNKTALLSWIVLDFKERGFAKVLPRLRQDHTDPVKALRAFAEQIESARREGKSASVVSQIQAMIKDGRL
jgi:hypothetical protein